MNKITKYQKEFIDIYKSDYSDNIEAIGDDVFIGDNHEVKLTIKGEAAELYALDNMGDMQYVTTFTSFGYLDQLISMRYIQEIIEEMQQDKQDEQDKYYDDIKSDENR